MAYTSQAVRPQEMPDSAPLTAPARVALFLHERTSEGSARTAVQGWTRAAAALHGLEGSCRASRAGWQM